MPDETNRTDVAAADASAEPAADDPVAAIRAERDKLHDQLLRTAAELENTRKRTRREVDEARSKGREDAIRELLPVFDNLERAGQAASVGTTDAKAIAEGVQMVLRLFEDHLQRLGVERLKSLGERFDPTLHDALQQVDSDEPPGTIVTEIQPGYRMGARLVRAATVIVARPRPAPAEPAEPKPS
ncbi:MAG: nucleotide exchange factor GrpE [Deltaproteobacteria bacterium]|nr:nucleotide exchange factor GrpE [Deltaproteobacteria bacterium]